MKQKIPETIIHESMFFKKCNVCEKTFYTTTSPGIANYYRCEECLKPDKIVYLKSLFCSIQ